jgi:hypothetical protein
MTNKTPCHDFCDQYNDGILPGKMPYEHWHCGRCGDSDPLDFEQNCQWCKKIINLCSFDNCTEESDDHWHCSVCNNWVGLDEKCRVCNPLPTDKEQRINEFYVFLLCLKHTELPDLPPELVDIIFGFHTYVHVMTIEEMYVLIDVEERNKYMTKCPEYLIEQNLFEPDDSDSKFV